MEEFIINIFNSQAFASGLLIVLIVGFGWFVNFQVWPFITTRYDKWADEYIGLKRMELEIEAERNTRFADAWRENTATLLKQHEELVRQGAVIANLLEVNKAIITTFLNFVDDKKLQGKLYELFREDGQ